VISIAALVAPIVGYISLGWFLATQLVWAITIVSLTFLILRFADELISHLFRASTRFGATVIGNIGIASARLEQIGVILSGIVRLALIVAAFQVVLLPLGIRSHNITSALKPAFFSFQLGDITISPQKIMFAIVLFAIGYAATRLLQRWLEMKLLPRTRLDVGLKTSIQTGIGYVGIVIAVIVASSSVGLNLENVTIIAGALSVGIGFGLQSVVNNFVSGLILLAERPIKVGDWIVVGAEQGYVRRISVRATEIETFDRSTIIVPNSDLISGTVKNWMHHNDGGRITIPVGVSYECDPDQVKQILLNCATAVDSVIASPAPTVYFVDFGDNSLDFELRCYMDNVNNALTAKSAIRFEIFRRFKEAGIEIPFPQRDINVRDLGGAINAKARPQDGGEP
jgi:potassium efflux system protein